jgi:hypothetical protein
MITAAMGLESKPEVVMSYLAEARKRDAENHAAHACTLWYLCQKWHGNHQQMYDFARGVCQNLRSGSHLHILIAYAHVERGIYALFFDRNQNDVSALWENQQVRDELVRAYKQGPASPNYRPSKLTHSELNFFGYCFARLNEQTLAKSVFEKIGDKYSEYPWTMFADPTAKFTASRNAAGL